MKILLAYTFLQVVLPFYLATTDECSVSSLYRRGDVVQAIPGKDCQVARLQRRSPEGIFSGYSKDESDTNSFSGKDKPSDDTVERKLGRRSNLYRRGDYHMLQHRSPLNKLQRRSPFFHELKDSIYNKLGIQKDNPTSKEENPAQNSQNLQQDNAPNALPSNSAYYSGYTPNYQGSQGTYPPTATQ
ncbi:hypothetical protein IWQ62_006488 [Dispira parvispora]|uniref:Uncharacterized protein n=1 Tax=Dispira parvispora TaxID=1520584 RepID=A0A9W8E019_9FUNG|nr:hypothetical protein IWQ62_006488 [Dispira parvispora]